MGKMEYVRKIVCFVFVLLILAGLVACSSKKKAEPSFDRAKLVDSKIAGIHYPRYYVDDLNESYNTEKEIKDAEKAYDSLSEEEKLRVENYQRLVLARAYFEYSEMLERAIWDLENGVKYNLLNPASYQRNGSIINIYKAGNDFYFIGNLDYSAQNRAGGYNRNTITGCGKWNSETGYWESIEEAELALIIESAEKYQVTWED